MVKRWIWAAVAVVAFACGGFVYASSGADDCPLVDTDSCPLVGSCCE